MTDTPATMRAAYVLVEGGLRDVWSCVSGALRLDSSSERPLNPVFAGAWRHRAQVDDWRVVP